MEDGFNFAKQLRQLTRDEEDFVCHLRTRGSMIPDSGFTGWVPMDTYSLNMRIGELEAQQIIKPGMRVLDLGAGNGTSTFVFAFRGYPTVGIEIFEPLATMGQEAIEEAVAKGLMKQGMASLFLGSYYPLEYIQRRNRGLTRAAMVEHIARSTHYHPVAEFDVQERYGIDYKSFDLWYIWAWQEQTFSVVECFAEHARDDAKLLLFNGATFPETLGARLHERSKCVVVKTKDRPQQLTEPHSPPSSSAAASPYSGEWVQTVDWHSS